LIGAADAVANFAGMTPDPGGELTSERAELDRRLGPERYVQLAAKGASLSTDEAVQLARDVAARIVSG
jgi:hypothetical protein